MKEIEFTEISKRVEETCRSMSILLPSDGREALKEMRMKETYPIAKDTLDIILENERLARETESPMCQDTGMVVAFVKLGQEVHIRGGFIEDAINEGVRRGYTEGYLRKSVVKDPLFPRENTKDNTPAVIHYHLITGDELEITLAAKGFGSENMSRLAMLKPSDGVEGVKKFVLETVEIAGPNACPPIVVGIGIGGTMEKAAELSKLSLMRSLNESNQNPEYKALEEKLLNEINALGIGPAGYGGYTTALKVQIESYPTHIAGLPVAVNINCHASRHATIRL